MKTNGTRSKSQQLPLPIVGESHGPDGPGSQALRNDRRASAALPRRPGAFRQAPARAHQDDGMLLAEIQEFVPDPDSTTPDVYAERLEMLDALGVNPLSERPAAADAAPHVPPDTSGEPVLNGLQLYLSQIGPIRLLTAAQELQLGKRIQGGDVEARDQMVRANLRLVVAVAKRYARAGRVPIMDLIQEGNLGLIRAAQKFDWRRGYRFSTYATWWIWQAILSHLAEQGRTIRIPVHASERLGRIRKAMAALAQTLGRQPRIDEIAAHLTMPVETVHTLLDRSVDPFPLSTPLTHADDDDRSIEEMREDENADRPTNSPLVHLTLGDLGEDLMRILDTYLPIQERRVVAALFGFLGDTTREAAVAALTEREGRKPTAPEVERYIVERAAELAHMPVERVTRIRSRALLRLRSRREVMAKLQWYREEQGSWPSLGYQKRLAARRRAGGLLALAAAASAAPGA